MVIEFEYSFACFGGDGDVLSDGADVYDGSAGALPVLLRGGGQQGLLYATTEPFLMPVRGVLSRIEFFASSPVDFTYIITVMLVMVVQLLLPSVY